MSFLNPVNEPVLRFKSTDADAPQINYNSRTAGDVKAVLKACLVTGYGTTPSAGWSVVNEVDHVAEFVSPSTSMSDYRLGIDDKTATNTVWYFQYQAVRVNPKLNSVTKVINYIDKTSIRNGWQLVISKKGLYFIEVFENTSITTNPLLCRIIFFGATKSALLSGDSGDTTGWWQVGYATSTDPAVFFERPDLYATYSIGGQTDARFRSTAISSMAAVQKAQSLSAIEIFSELYISNLQGVVSAQQPGLLLCAANELNNATSIFDTVVNGRPALSVSLGTAHPSGSASLTAVCRVLIPLDYWEY